MPEYELVHVLRGRQIQNRALAKEPQTQQNNTLKQNSYRNCNDVCRTKVVFYDNAVFNNQLNMGSITLYEPPFAS